MPIRRPAYYIKTFADVTSKAPLWQVVLGFDTHDAGRRPAGPRQNIISSFVSSFSDEDHL